MYQEKGCVGCDSLGGCVHAVEQVPDFVSLLVTSETMTNLIEIKLIKPVFDLFSSENI